jgi:predicted nucleic-acid-binding protein
MIFLEWAFVKEKIRDCPIFSAKLEENGKRIFREIVFEVIEFLFEDESFGMNLKGEILSWKIKILKQK